MKATYTPKEWRDLYARCVTRPQQAEIIGPPVNLAARVLGISRARIAQLVREDKLDSVSVRDETGRRIAHMITLASLDRRRMIRRLPGQWKPREVT